MRPERIARFDIDTILYVERQSLFKWRRSKDADDPSTFERRPGWRVTSIQYDLSRSCSEREPFELVAAIVTM